MIALLLAAALTAGLGGRHDNAGILPACSNRTMDAVARRAGCALGATRCWATRGGFCGDHVQRKLARDGAATPLQLAGVPAEAVRAGDVAIFAARAHMAYVERVVRDRSGRPISVDVSEYNFGTCWIDEGLMVTDRYGVESRRRAVPIAQVDGGFMRARRPGDR